MVDAMTMKGVFLVNYIGYIISRNSKISNEQKIMKIRSIASQVMVTMISNLVKFSAGSFIGFAALLLAELSQENSDVKVTKGQLSWFASYFFMAPVGAISFGLLSHTIGGRVALLIISITLSISSIIFYFATNSTMILVAQAFVGLMLSPTASIGTTYITEIADPHLRSLLITSGYLSMSFGMFFVMLMRLFFKWKIIAIVLLIFPVMGFLGLLFVPNSPYWLARKGRFEEAEVALAWLRGWTTLENVRTEFLALKESNIKVNSDDTRSQKQSISVLIKSCTQRSLWMPLSITIYVLIMFDLVGCNTIKTFNVVIFRKIETPFDIYLAGAIYDGVRIIGGIICMFCINTLGKRKLLFISLFGAGTAHIVVAIVVHLIKLEIGNLTYLVWIPPVMIIFASFILSMGLEKVTYVLNSEILPNRFREIGMGMGRCLAGLISAMFGQVFLYMVDAMTLQGVFLFFGINGFIALVTLYFIVPETEGKTLVEIENHFAGKRTT
ncbi:hypothetical protein TSAR_010105 [Trichomalopsis sarcophagae]|uniref:Major facilitator superfamily (MFS) profile domain-containing protein n=1 Tax=Trichomalopsis sarcophagae TaxID=543379 RepID=A0A232F146_9HYME|nr:hypothetical protein TSAR_010105 [Trichomalopsis sarcophagae]